MKNLILIGAGGHCKSCIDVIETQGEYKIIGLFDIKEKIDKEIFGYKIIDCDENIEKYINKDTYFLITLGQIKTAKRRKELFDKLIFFGAKFATVISPYARVSSHAKVLCGSIVMHNALVNAGVEIGNNCIINSKALLEHDVNIGAHCHISTSAVLNGNVRLGDCSFVGSNSTIVQGICLPFGSFVKAGSLIK